VTIYRYRQMLRYFCRYSGSVEMEKGMESKRIEIRLSPHMADRLKAEAVCLGMSLNAYVVKLIAYRKHARRAFSEQEIIASEQWPGLD
jgi:predicted HicB family RNase H-like nuclease